MSDLHVRPAAESDLAYVERLLAEAGLPRADVRDGAATFFVAETAGRSVGVGGLESHGDAVLLRSVVVEPDARGEGYGRALVGAVLDRATDGTSEAYLLTTTAAPFFEALGFERVPRASAPAAIRESPEFADLCPDSATCMRRDLPV